MSHFRDDRWGARVVDKRFIKVSTLEIHSSLNNTENSKNMCNLLLDTLISQIHNVKDYKIKGTITAIKGLLIKCSGIFNFVNIGSPCKLYTREGKVILAEVIAVDSADILLMSFQHLSDVGIGCTVEVVAQSNKVFPEHSWLGRVIDSVGKPLDNKGDLLQGKQAYNLHSSPPPAYERKLVNNKLD